MKITRLVSGAQTGTDRGGLDAAIYCDMPHGGFCPKGRIAEDGTIPVQYNLVEMPTKDYVARTEANVVDSDATVIFTFGKLSGGSRRTADFAAKHGRPWLHVDMSGVSRQQAVDAIVAWLKADCPPECVLNVAGSRESKAPGIGGKVMAWMVDVIGKANGKIFYPIGDCDRDDGDETPHFHPKTVLEAVQVMLDALPPDAKERLKSLKTSKNEFINSHFGMAMWIRNSMIHGNRNRIDLFAAFQRGVREGKWKGNAEPDDVSGVIVGLVWASLHGG